MSDTAINQERLAVPPACLLAAALQPGWLVYILECADGSFYTGITNDVERRLQAHNAGTGARYTRGRLPVRPVYVEACEGKSAALKRELAIKRLSRLAKQALIAPKQL